MENNDQRINKIKALNDQLRTTGMGGKIMLSQGLLAQGQETVAKVLTLVKNYNDFGEDNDPYGEHDFGAISHGNIKYFWKIDYYDLEYEMHSIDNTNPHITNRVLTIFLAEEY
jgi:hypothetical protein